MSVNMLRYFKDILLFFHQRVKKSFLNIYFLLVSLLCTIYVAMLVIFIGDILSFSFHML